MGGKRKEGKPLDMLIIIVDPYFVWFAGYIGPSMLKDVSTGGLTITVWNGRGGSWSWDG